MIKLKLAAAFCAVAAASLVSCGPGSSSGTTSTSSAQAVASNGWKVKAVAGANLNIQVSVTVVGPATVRGGCIASVDVSLFNPDGTAVPPPRPGFHCTALTLIQIPAGTTKTLIGSAAAPHHGRFTVQTQVNTTTAPTVLPAISVQA